MFWIESDDSQGKNGLILGPINLLKDLGLDFNFLNSNFSFKLFLTIIISVLRGRNEKSNNALLETLRAFFQREPFVTLETKIQRIN